MKNKDGLKRQKDGSYILKHKTKRAKKGECEGCGKNPKGSKVIYRYNTEDMIAVREHIEDHLTRYSSHKAVIPKWCGKCQALIDYKVIIDYKK